MGSSAPRIKTLAIAAFGLLTLLLMLSLISHASFNATRRLARHSTDVLSLLTRVDLLLRDAETGQRGYLLTGKPEYLAPYEEGRVELPRILDELRLLTAEDPAQRARVDQLGQVAQGKLGELAVAIELRRRGDEAGALSRVRTDVGLHMMQEAQGILRSLEDEVSAGLSRRRVVADRTQQFSFFLIIGSSLALVAVGKLLYDVTGDLLRRDQLEALLVEEKDRLVRSEREAQAARKGSEAAMATQARRARLSAAISGAAVVLNAGGELRAMLGHCCDAAVTHLDAALCRIFIVDDDGATLELMASAGLYNRTDGGDARVPIGQQKVGEVAAARVPYLSNAVGGEPSVCEREWALRERVVSFAAYPLIVEERVLGVIALFARAPFGSDELDALQAIANTIAMGVARKRNESMILEREQRYRFLADSLPSQVWTALPDGRLDYVNQRVLQYFDRGYTQMIDDGWRAVLHPDDLPACLERWTSALRSGEPYEVEFRLLRARDGRYRWHIARGVPMRDASGAITKWFGTNTDIEDRKVQEREREGLIAALGRSNQELDQFAYVASHDLKAPLRGIANLSQWIEDDLGEKLSEPLQKNMKLLRGRVHRLEALIDGILDYSRAGRDRSGTERVSVGKLLAEVVELVAPGPGVAIRIGPDMPLLSTSRTPLQQVFLNLIGNAIKHARRGDAPAEIEVSVADAGAQYDFAVSDNGPGIDPRYHERIFGLFQTLEARDQVEGTGIGLSVVKKIVEARGGRAWVVSQPGAGATFHFLWPKQEGPV